MSNYQVIEESKKFIKSVECDENRDGTLDLKETPYLDSEGIPTVGVGHALAVKNNKGKYVVNEPLPEGISDSDKTKIEEITEKLNNKEKIEDYSFDSTLEVNTIDKLLEDDIEKLHNMGVEEMARENYERENSPKKYKDLKSDEKKNLVDEAKEDYEKNLPEGAKIAFDSLSFNNPGSLIGPRISQAIKDGNLADMFSEVAFDSDGVDKSYKKGIRNRRFQEGGKILDNILEGGVTKEEAEQLKAMVA